jgi:hypothetical protein
MNRALTTSSRGFASIARGVGRRAAESSSSLCILSAASSSSLFFNSRSFVSSSEHEQQQQQNGFFSSSNVGRILAIGGIVLVGGVAVNEILDKRRRVLAAEQTQKLSEAILTDLRSALDPSRVDISEGIRQQHGKDFSYHEPHLPDVVVFPLSEQEVQEIVNISSKYNLPLVPYAGGTSLEGHTSALNGGICINFSQMAKVLKLNKEDMDVTVQPGISYDELNEQLKGTGLFFPMDPGPGACIGVSPSLFYPNLSTTSSSSNIGSLSPSHLSSSSHSYLLLPSVTLSSELAH